ncbi:ABC transporter substrate-binding protein [Pandoraea anhela]|uniref:NMT1/THI5-like domain-containing protein n=1 Tax=Pandoraea anhela TaxID=2508295 RepID=A0A5E4YUU4_9BURK|nr:ABC transporter substrate-binding protein [Pandoraea anhela]VVE51693.1 NMT1/THI5-like domain-containing protein [Pandoraea anhela]
MLCKHTYRFALVGGGLLLAGWSLAASAELTRIRYGNTTDMTLAQAPVVVAKQMNYFKEEGLDVEMISFKGAGTLIPQMLSKRVDIGYPNPDTLILSHEPGKQPLPLKFFYNSARTSIWEFVVNADSPIKSLKDLNGKNIGVGAMTFGNVPITRAEFKDIGVNATLVPVGTGSAAFLALTNKSIDAINLYDTQIATLESQGTKIRRLSQLVRYSQLPSNGLVAHDDMIRDKPQLLGGFGRAIAKATVFCEANKVACVELFWKEYPNTKPVGDPAKVLADGVQVLSARLTRMLAFPGGQTARRWGESDPQAWGNFAEALYQGGQMQARAANVQGCYTNALVPEFAKFDAAKVVAQAKAFKE